jgi:[ribosomal protein S5]-alanine N-acetyltransferase
MESPGATHTSSRLQLRPMPWPAVQAILGHRRLADWAADYPDQGDLVIAGELRKAGRHHHEAASGPWGHRQVVERSTGLVVGGIGIFGPPEDGIVEVGYGIVPSRQGRNYATEAVITLVAALWSHPELAAVVADTDPDNRASQRVLEKAGFVRVGPHDPTNSRYQLVRPAPPS